MRCPSALIGACLPLLLGSLQADGPLDLSLVPGVEPPQVSLVGLAGLYGDEALRSHMRNVFKGDRVTLLIYGDRASRVLHHSSGLSGWVESRWLEGIDPQMVMEWRERAAEAVAVKQAIAEKRVIVGMTPNQVRESMGRPNAQSFREDESGRFDIWSYVTFEFVPQRRRTRDPTTGLIHDIWVRVKQETGTFRVEFHNGVVIAVEQILLADGPSIRQPQFQNP